MRREARVLRFTLQGFRDVRSPTLAGGEPPVGSVLLPSVVSVSSQPHTGVNHGHRSNGAPCTTSTL